MNIIMDNLLFGVGYFFMKKKGKCRELSKTHIAQATNFRGIVLAKRHLSSKMQWKVMKSYNIGWMNYNRSTD
jgi:hypothetical protein